LGVDSHIEYIKLLLQLIRFDYFCLLVRMKTRLQFSMNANNWKYWKIMGYYA